MFHFLQAGKQFQSCNKHEARRARGCGMVIGKLGGESGLLIAAQKHPIIPYPRNEVQFLTVSTQNLMSG